LALIACARNADTNKLLVRQLNDSAVTLTMKSFDSLSYVKAIELLDHATQLDSNSVSSYWNKLAFQSQIKQHDKALGTVKELIRLRPNTPDFYVTAGVLYEQLGDTITSEKYFRKGLSHFDNLLDTMSIRNTNYSMLRINKAVTLVLSGEEKKGQELLQLYYKEEDSLYREAMKPFIGKSRQEILEGLKNPYEFFR
jgi:tetratricopeptide (TPR) repeat protein